MPNRKLLLMYLLRKRKIIFLIREYPLSIRDHNLIYAVRKIGLPRGQPKFIPSRHSKLFNEENFLTDLKNASWPVIKSAILNVVDKHAPRRVMRVRNKRAPW
ncbi:unnamed protein product, partial [Porites lobata]